MTLINRVKQARQQKKAKVMPVPKLVTGATLQKAKAAIKGSSSKKKSNSAKNSSAKKKVTAPVDPTMIEVVNNEVAVSKPTRCKGKRVVYDNDDDSEEEEIVLNE
jgi:hypothetical protein